MNWVTNNGFENYSQFQLYTASLYYTITTISTVGYGDITGTNSYERYVCVFN